MEDTKFMFYATSLNLHHTESMNDTLYRFLDAVSKYLDISFMQEGISVPTTWSDTDKFESREHYAIMDLLPRPKVFQIAGHACFWITDVLSLHMVTARPFEVTVIPHAKFDRNNRELRIRHKIHGAPAMNKLLEVIYEMHEGEWDLCESFFGYFTTWHDAFLQSYVKQKMNNVWLYIVNFPDSRLTKTSRYHTYCVAVGSGHLDHTPVLDWFSKQMEGLLKGTKVYCARRQKCIHVKIGAVANMTDRPEKASSLCTMLLGRFGRIASWAADVHPRVLPDCNKCHGNRLSNIIAEGLRAVKLDGKCGRCCQWDLTSKSPSLKKIKPPKNYPKNTDIGAPTPPDRTIGQRETNYPNWTELRLANIRCYICGLPRQTWVVEQRRDGWLSSHMRYQ